MIDYAEIERATSADFIDNSATRVPICICVDASLSMELNGGIKHVNAGIEQFIQKAASNIYSSDAVELCLIVFGPDIVKTVIDFTNVTTIQENDMFKPIKASGGSPLGTAVELAVKKITERHEMYESYGIACYTPWLIIMSDGEADDGYKVNEIANDVIEMQKPHNGKKPRLKVKCIGMGTGEENKDLQKFSLDGTVKKWDALQIESFFNYLSESATQISCAYPGEEDTIGLF